jgi:hypothetical protein
VQPLPALPSGLAAAKQKKTMRKKSKLDLQCDEVGWPLNTTHGYYVGSGKWSFDEIVNCGPEEFVAAQLATVGFKCCWCEGGSLNLLMKAAALDVLVRRNIFGSREDAIRRFLEAQFTLLNDHRLEIVSRIRSIADDQLQANIFEICSDAFIRSFYPRVSSAFVTALAQAVGQHHLADVATLFITNPYGYRAGWPDLTIVKDGRLSFVEVKTTDKLHASQMRFAREVARPLNLPCSVVRLEPVQK